LLLRVFFGLNALPVNIPTNSGYITGNGVGKKKSKTLALDSVYIYRPSDQHFRLLFGRRLRINTNRLQRNSASKLCRQGALHCKRRPKTLKHGAYLMHSKIEYMGGGRHEVVGSRPVPSPSK